MISNMKRYIVILMAFIVGASATAAAQKLVIGQRAPEFKAAAWLTEKPAGDKAQLLVFYHSSSKPATDQLGGLDGLAKKYAGKLNVTVLARETEEKVRPLVLDCPRNYYVALDDNGKTFSNFGVQYIPFSVLADARGQVLWFGNPAQLDGKTLESLLR